jgi:hypothetical protein
VDLNEGAGGFLRQAAQNYLPSRDDVVVPPQIARDFGLRDGTEIVGLSRDGGGGRRTLVEVQKASGLTPEEYRALPHFQDLISVNPNEPFRLAGDAPGAETSLRVIDLIAPIGRGQRGLIVSPPKAGKTTLLEHLGVAIAKHHPEVHLILLLIDERPEEVTHFRRAVPAEVLASSADSQADAHIRLAKLAMERSKRMVESGKHVVILLDSLTRLGRASNREMGPGGRTMSGGVDNRALQFPRQFFGAARNCENSGSLTILATALIDTGQPDGRGHLPGVQGHRQHGADPRPLDRGSPDLPRGRRAEVGHPPRGAALHAGRAREAAPAAPRARRPVVDRSGAVPHRQDQQDAVQQRVLVGAGRTVAHRRPAVPLGRQLTSKSRPREIAVGSSPNELVPGTSSFRRRASCAAAAPAMEATRSVSRIFRTAPIPAC